MKKRVVKVGSSFGIVFNKQERSVYGIEYGDVLDLEFVVKKNKVRGKKVAGC